MESAPKYIALCIPDMQYIKIDEEGFKEILSSLDKEELDQYEMREEIVEDLDEEEAKYIPIKSGIEGRVQVLDATLHDISYINFMNKRYDIAIKEYKLQLKLDPGNFQAHDYLGYIYEDRGDLVLAEEHVRKAIELCPNNDNLEEHLFVILLKKGQRK